MITIPIKVHLDLSEDEELAFATWFESNQPLIIKANMAACWNMAVNQELPSIDVVYIYDIAEGDNAMPVFELSITRDDVENNLHECEDYFVENEDYENAAKAVECKKLFLNHTK
jgi:hypothetical protein